MSSAAPSKRQLTTNSLPEGHGVLAWFLPIFRTTVGSKFLVALTGIALIGFVIVHMLGNLQMFLGREAINAYAQWLKDLGPLLWLLRGGLLAVFALHIFLALRLKKRSVEARPVPYVSQTTVQASPASLYMVQTGLVILAFVLFHLAHFTFGWLQDIQLTDARGRHDVYGMILRGFGNPAYAALYLVAQLALLLHLSHGVASVFQTLGANSPRWQRAIRILGWGVTLLVVLGNIAIVFAVWLKILT